MKIDFEAHFYTNQFVKFLEKRRILPKYVHDRKMGIKWLKYTKYVREPHPPIILEKLLETGHKRIEEMDKTGIDIQVLSLSTPGCEQFEQKPASKLARDVNDQLSKVVEKYPDRFIGLAALAPQDPAQAADELERSVKELGLRGVKIHSNIRGSYLDSKRYWVILEKADKLGVPIFLHPTVPHISQLSRGLGYSLAGPPFGFLFETALCMMRLILSGVFDKFRNLRFFLGHMGEGLPLMLNRIDFPMINPWVYENLKTKLQKKPSESFLNHVFVGTSGNFGSKILKCVIDVVGIDRTVFATDYPYEKTLKAIEQVEEIYLSEHDKEKIYHFNAKKLLRL